MDARTQPRLGGASHGALYRNSARPRTAASVARLISMSTLAERKYVELHEKLDSLQTELAAWQALAATDKDPLRLHRSQIAKLATTLGDLVSSFQKALPKVAPQNPNDDDVFLANARNTENMFLATHSVWAFFRKKLAQRLEPGFSKFLDAADELAWACYHPAFKTAGVPIKEPPLVFLNGALSPFMVAREKAFVPEDVPPRFLGLEEFKGLVSRLPIPVIGVPWAQAGHVPDALSIAHEVGHVIEDEFSLEEELDDAVRSVVPKTRQPQWLGWRAEIFADLWACAAVGPAYVSTLCDFLAADPLRNAAEKGQQNSYPTPHLRILINLAALDLAKFPNDAGPVQAVRTLWDSAGAAPPSSLHESDVRAVVAALLRTKLKGFGGKSVHQVLSPFNPGRFTDANNAFAALQRGEEGLGTTDVCTVFAAARQGYDHDPAAWRKDKTGERLLAHFDRTKPPGETLLGLGTRGRPARAMVVKKPKEVDPTATEMLAELERLVAPQRSRRRA
jgi:hypothetical protein